MTTSGEPAVVANGLSKRYRLYEGHGRGLVRSLLSRHPERHYTENQALEDVSFQVMPGEVLGVIGRNGSGKSTLLRLLAGVSQPTSGELVIRGRARCLLAPGVGFDPRLSGLDNIVFGSIALGISRDVAEANLYPIIDFAELWDHIERPTMYYSSGMRSRLALAVALQDIPEVLMLDEALAAGDAYFQAKCVDRITEICESDATVVIVTHSTAIVNSLCDQALLLEGGRVAAEGDPEQVVARYTGAIDGGSGRQAPRPAAVRSGAPATAGQGSNHSGNGASPASSGDLDVVFAYMSGADGYPAETFDHGAPLELHILLRATNPIRLARFTLELYSEALHTRLTTLGTEHVSADDKTLAVFPLRDLEGEHALTVRWPENPLGSGVYFWSLSIRPFDPPGEDDSFPAEYLRVPRLCAFRSRSFPGRPIGDKRTAVLEPATALSLNALPGRPPAPRVLDEAPTISLADAQPRVARRRREGLVHAARRRLAALVSRSER